MADKTETLLFLVDVQVRGAQALRALDAELDAAAAAHERRLLALSRATGVGNGGVIGGAPRNGGNGGTTIIPSGGNGGRDTAIWGVRGPRNPGSKENPMVFAEESGQAAGLGSLAAAIADARKGDQPTVKAAPVASSPSDEGAVRAQAAKTLADILAARRVQQMVGGNGNGAYPVIVNGNGNGAGLGTLSAAAAAHRLSLPISRVYQMAAAGQIAGASKSGGQWNIPEQAVVDMLAAGGGGGGVPPIRPRVAAGGGGSADNRSLLARLGWGGTLGLAAGGSALSFAGLGAEHILFTALGIAGSAAGAAGGAGLLGLGSLGKLGVGGGSDMLVGRTAQQNVKTLNTDINNLQRAVAIYGQNSKQAAQAQAQLNYDLSQMGPAAQSALNVANQLQNLTNNVWPQVTAGAQKQADAIFSQVLTLATQYAPMVAQAAQQNLGIINQDIKPLFDWLQGPQGVQIFRDLEYLFARDLPTAVHAFDQAMEFVLRVMDLAAQHTGGFMSHVDHLFTRLNSLSNSQIDAEITKLVDTFRLWDHFLGLVGKDLYLLFHQDVGTGNSIIGALSKMLEKLQAYEKSARGQAQIQNIFMVHKTEILDLLHIFGQLAAAFGHVYMAVAPAAVTVMNDVVLPVLDAVAKALAAIAHSSPLAADALGALLIGAKFGGWAAVLKSLQGGFGWLRGSAPAAAGGASAVENAVASGGGAAVARGLPGLVEGGALGLGGALESVGLGGAGMAVVSGGAALSSALPILIPAVVAGVAAYFGLHALFGQAPVATATSGGLTLPSTASSYRGGRGGRTVSLPGSLANDTLNVQEVGNFANYSAERLKALIGEMKQADGVRLNGVSVPKDQLIALAEAALKTKDAFNQSFNEAWTAVNTFYRNTARTLPALYDDFNSNMKLIASTVGLNTSIGHKLVATNVAKMVDALRAGMNSGDISVKDGMRALNQILDAGLKAGGITWKTEWTTMIDTVVSLYAHHKLTTAAYLADLRSMESTAFGHIKSDTENAYQQTFSNLKHQYDQGLITHGQFLDKMHQAQLDANQTQSTDMAAWVANLDAAMKASGALTAKGMQVITDEVNQALGLFGAAKLPIPQAIAWINYQQTGGAGATSMRGVGHGATAATGALIQFGMAGAHGHDTIPVNFGGQRIMVGSGEVGAVFNGSQQAALDAILSPLGGLPGFLQTFSTPHYMAGGGLIQTPKVGGAGGLATLVGAALAKAAGAANSWLGLKAGFAGSGGAPGGPVSGNVTGWLQQAMAATGVSGPLWLALLQRQVMRESGGNPHAINLWDSNARAGHPSKGLLQTIDSTFAAYALPGHGNIWNPVDNAIAAIRYMIATYGGGNPNVAAQVMWGRGGGGYARGGIIGRMMASLGGHGGFGGGGSAGGWPDWYPVGISNAAITGASGALSNQFQGDQTSFGNLSSLTGILQGLNPGTSLASLGLTGAGLRAAGLTRRQARGLIGGGPASFDVLAQIDQHEIGSYRTQDQKLRQLYRDALHNHNTKLANAILGQLQGVDAALAQATSDKQGALNSKIQAKAQKFADRTSAIGDTLATLGSIENLAPGTSLAGLGLSPAILKTLGLSSAQGLVGTGLSYFQNLAQNQGGHITAAQLAQAKAGVDAQNQLLSQQEAPIESELAYYQSMLPSLKGSNRTSAVAAMQQLTQQLLGLQGTIQQNTDGLTSLTTATNANTNATAQMTGTVAYTFQGQSGYTASLSSDSTLALGVGN